MWGDQEPPKDNWQAVCKPLDVGEPATAIDIGPGIIKGLRLVIAYYDNMLLISVATYFYHTLRDLKKKSRGNVSSSLYDLWGGRKGLPCDVLECEF